MKLSTTIALITMIEMVNGWPPIGPRIRRTSEPSLPPPGLETADNSAAASRCEVDGKWYEEGEFWPDACTRCECRGGSVGCVSSACPPSPCVDATKVDGVCCRVCPKGPNCMGPGGAPVPVGSNFTLPEHGVACRCMQMGHYTGVTCRIVTPQ